MKNIVKKNQLIITALSIMIAVAGYLNFSGREMSVAPQDLEVSNMETVGEEGTEALESTEAVDTMDISDADEIADVASKEGAVGNMDDAEVSAPVLDEVQTEDLGIGDAVLTEAQAADFITKAKLAREQTRAKSKEMLMNMIENDKIDAKSKEQAEQKVLKLTENMEMETQVEQLLGAKGFSNSVVSISNDNTDVLIAKETLSEVEKAQIEDIVMRKTGMDMDQIVISTMKNQK
ncbi:MAG TPA: SpoIIIAH-like family protein [Candidatus Scybalomonas excrementigallinarum]|nr:SpoIIIAH-like family protein [Candidatus Scybalomonas excrementigallinarum]